MGPRYVKTSAVDDITVIRGITNSDHRSSHYYPENGRPTVDREAAYETRDDPTRSPIELVEAMEKHRIGRSVR